MCTLFPNGAILRKPGTCAETITCQNGVSMEGPTTCSGTQGYNLESKKCASVSDAYCSSPCAKSSPKWVGVVRNCIDWVECNGSSQVKTGTCPAGQIFNQNDQLCEHTPKDFVCEKTYDVCLISPKEQKFWDEYNCHKYFYCDKNQKQQTGECSTGLYYDRLSGTCVAKAQVDCYQHPIPENVCGTAKLAIRDRFVKDQATCRGYFYCRDLGSGVPDQSPIWGQCDKDYFFDESTQSCRNRDQVSCDEDRCDGISSGFVLAPDKGCHNFLVCSDGYTWNKVRCEDDYYFDPLTQECEREKVSYPICA